MNTPSKHPVLITIVLLCCLSLIAVSCQLSSANTPTYVEAIYYLEYQDPAMNGMTTFIYIQLYYHGVFTFVDITPESPTPSTVVDTYDQIAVAWLEPYGVPYHTGNYVILGDRIYLNYPPMGLNGIFPATQSTGTFSLTKLELTAADCSHLEYLRYPPGNDAPLPTAPPQPCVAGTSTPITLTQPSACQLGTWRVDTDSYLAWMNAVESKTPNITFTKIDPPFHYRFKDDGSFTIYLDLQNSMSFESKDPAGGGEAIPMELDYSSGAMKGTYGRMEPDQAYPGLPLLTINILDNPITVIGIKSNGHTISQMSSLNVIPMIDTIFFKKVGYICSGDSLQLIPLAAGLPKDGYWLSRDSTWQPINP